MVLVREAQSYDYQTVLSMRLELDGPEQIWRVTFEAFTATGCTCGHLQNSIYQFYYLKCNVFSLIELCNIIYDTLRERLGDAERDNPTAIHTASLASYSIYCTLRIGVKWFLYREIFTQFEDIGFSGMLILPIGKSGKGRVVGREKWLAVVGGEAVDRSVRTHWREKWLDENGWESPAWIFWTNKKCPLGHSRTVSGSSTFPKVWRVALAGCLCYFPAMSVTSKSDQRDRSYSYPYPSWHGVTVSHMGRSGLGSRRTSTHPQRTEHCTLHYTALYTTLYRIDDRKLNSTQYKCTVHTYLLQTVLEIVAEVWPQTFLQTWVHPNCEETIRSRRSIT